MHKLIKLLLTTACLGLSVSAIAGNQNYVYSPSNGTHEVKAFHGCFDDNDAASRPKINLIMNNISINDVTIETRPLVSGKPSSEMITFRLKNQNASITVQFQSPDGPHCQQGVASISFRDATYRNFTEMGIKR